MQLLRIPVLLRLRGGLVRRIHHFVPRVLDPLREPVEVRFRPGRTLPDHAEDAVGACRVVRGGFSGEEVRRGGGVGWAEVLKHDVHEERRHQERRAVEIRDLLCDCCLLFCA